MSATEAAYRLALSLLEPSLPLLARAGGKVGRGARGRMGLGDRIARWAATERDPERPLAWFHAPSVGEGLQARAVLDAVRRRRADVQIVYTFFSPSAENLARTVGADFADYLPFDSPAAVRRAIAALRPTVLAFSKGDVWPVLTREAAATGVRLCLLSGTLPSGSSRLRGPARALLGPSYRRLDRVAAISAGDAARFALLGVEPSRTTVMGDARFDQVWARAQRGAAPTALVQQLRDPERATVVAGSTWLQDEERLFAALAAHGDGERPPRLILVPHEPTPQHLTRSAAALDALGLSHARLSALPTSLPDVVVVDRTGILGDLYAVADVAYVGGGFGTAGLHSVLEPAAFGAPVLFGPRHANAREAAELIGVGGATSVGDAAEMADTLRRWLTDRAVREAAGAQARAYVDGGRGAAERGADVVLALVDAARNA